MHQKLKMINYKHRNEGHSLKKDIVCADLKCQATYVDGKPF